MKNTSIFPQKEVKKNLTIRVSPSLRKEAEAVAKENGVSLAVVIETGIKLAIEQAKKQKP